MEWLRRYVVYELKVQAARYLRWVEEFQDKLQKNEKEALLKAARFAATLAKNSALYKSHTFALRRSIRGQLVGAHKATTVASARHAYWVENGNRPKSGANRIYPKTAKALRWEDEHGVHYRKWVRPAKPRPFMMEARKLAEPFLEYLLRNAVSDAAK